MSRFEDIHQGYTELPGDPRFGLVYTRNCGWLDLGHMNPDSNKKIIGARNLWRQLNDGGRDAEISFWYDYPPDFRKYGYSQNVLDAMRRDKKARFPDGETGFIVSLRQEMFLLKKYGSVGTTENCLIRRNLPNDQLKSVALSIFMVVSFGFEIIQRSLEWGGVANFLTEHLLGKPYDSGFSREDLFSDLVGFYIGIGAISKKDAIAVCDPVPEDIAVKIWESEGALGKRKNEQFYPDFAKDSLLPPSAGTEIGRSKSARQLPPIFSSIAPQHPGKNYLFMDH